MKKLSLSLALMAVIMAAKAQNNFEQIQQSFTHTNNNVIMIAAHRGPHLKYPENSIPAIKEGVNLGIDIVELDIRLTRDKKLVLMHDKTVDRTTTGKGRVSDYTFEELRKLRLRIKDSVTQEVVPTLEEALAITKGKVLIDLDIKEKDCVDSIIALTARTHTEQNVIFFVYKPEFAKMIKDRNSKFYTMVRTQNANQVDSCYKITVPQVVHIDPSHYTTGVTGTVKSNNGRVWINALGDVDDEVVAGNIAAFEKVLKNGANIIQTDQPALLKKYLESKGLYHSAVRTQ